MEVAEDVEGSSRRKHFVPHTPPQGALYTHDPALSMSVACSGLSDVKKLGGREEVAEDVEGSSRRKSFVPHTPPQGALYTHE